MLNYSIMNIFGFGYFEKLFEISNLKDMKCQDQSDSSLISQDLFIYISKILNDVLLCSKSNSSESAFKIDSRVFELKHSPSITIKDYLVKIYNGTEIELSTLIISLILVDRFCLRSCLQLTSKNLHLVVAAALLVSAKYNEDVIYESKCFALVAGIDYLRLIKIEHEFLEGIDYMIYVNYEEYGLFRSLLFQ